MISAVVRSSDTSRERLEREELPIRSKFTIRTKQFVTQSRQTLPLKLDIIGGCINQPLPLFKSDANFALLGKWREIDFLRSNVFLVDVNQARFKAVRLRFYFARDNLQG